MSHTPKPWYIKHQWNVFAGERLVASAGGYASNFTTKAVREENIANAHLIAAAPELLEALEAVLPLVRPMSMLTHANVDAVGGARYAIAKARGASRPSS